MKRTVLAFTAVVIGGVCHCALAETIHDHFGLDKDPVVAVTVSYVPSHFTSDEGTFGANRDPQLVAKITHILKHLPAAGEVQQQFRQEMHSDRRIIELHTRAGNKHVLKILGTELPRLLAPAASAGNVHGTYGTTDGRRREQQLFDLVRPIADTGLVWGKPSGGLQCRLLPETQSVSLPRGDILAEVCVIFELRNVGQETAMFLPWYTPLEDISGDVFRVIGPDGERVNYLGEHADRGPPELRDFIRIPPGVKLARRFCLYYDFTKPGRYRVDVVPQREDWLASGCKAYYDGDAEDASANRDNVWSGKLSSNAVSVNVVGATSESAREETAAAGSIFEYFGLSEDSVIWMRISHAPKGDFDSECHPPQSTDNTIPIGQLVELLKQLPASGSVYKKFAKDIEQWRIELKMQSGKMHQLTFYGIRLRSPQTKGGSFYDGPLEQEKRLLELVRRVYSAGADWGKPSGGLQCRLLPTKQTVTVNSHQEADDTPVFMTFELRDVGGFGVRLLPWYTPLEGIGYPMFEVIGPDGKEVKYDGPRMDRPPATPRDYVKIPRMLKLTRRFQLPYDLTKPGPYRVTFRMRLPTKPDDWYYGGDLEMAKKNPDNVWAGELASNTVTVHVARTAEHGQIGTGRLRSNTVAVEIAPSVGEILGAVDLEPLQMATLRKWIGRVDVRQWIAKQPSRPVDPAALADFLKTLPIDFDKQEMAILTALGSTWGKAVGGLQCRLEPSRQIVEVAPGARPEDVKVYVMYRLRNVTAKPITFLPEDTPLGPGREMWLRADRADGKEVSGWGEHPSFPPAGRGDYVVVPPGGELKQRVRLKYDLTSPGSYRVWSQTLDRVRLDPTNSAVRRYYDGDTDQAAKNLDNVWTGQLRSNTATVDVISPATKAGGASGDRPSGKAAVVPDYETAKVLAKAMADTEQGGLFKFGERVANNGAEFLPGLVALVEKGDGWIHEKPGLRQWEYAAYVLGKIGDQRCGPVLATRLNDQRATSYYLVKPLGQLRVREAVPYLVRWLKEENEKRWEVRSSAYGAQANYMIEALEQITGEDFSPGIGPSGHVERYVNKKQDIQAAIGTWWTREGRREYGQGDVHDTRPDRGGGGVPTNAKADSSSNAANPQASTLKPDANRSAAYLTGHYVEVYLIEDSRALHLLAPLPSVAAPGPASFSLGKGKTEAWLYEGEEVERYVVPTGPPPLPLPPPEPGQPAPDPPYTKAKASAGSFILTNLPKRMSFRYGGVTELRIHKLEFPSGTVVSAGPLKLTLRALPP